MIECVTTDGKMPTRASVINFDVGKAAYDQFLKPPSQVTSPSLTVSLGALTNYAPPSRLTVNLASLVSQQRRWNL
jgi:hypothetical protein